MKTKRSVPSIIHEFSNFGVSIGRRWSDRSSSFTNCKSDLQSTPMLLSLVRRIESVSSGNVGKTCRIAFFTSSLMVLQRRKRVVKDEHRQIINFVQWQGIIVKQLFMPETVKAGALFQLMH